MAETEGKSTATLPWAPLLAVLAAVAGLTALLPSRSARPPAPSETAFFHEGNEVSARLWQDPLSVAREAAAAHLPGKPAAANKPQHKDLTQSYRELATEAGRPPVVLVVCEPGSPYAEDVERRVRDRAGIIQALAAEGYLPRSSTSLRYAMIGGSPAEDVLPFEEFKSFDRTRLRPVLLVWLADDALSKKGLLYQLDALGTTLLPNGLPEMRVLGPNSSPQYRRMLENAAPEESAASLKALAPNLAFTQIYSCKASAPEAVLATGLPWINADPEAKTHPKTRTEAVLTRKLRGLGATEFRLTRTICPDNELTSALWKELENRGISTGEDVAVIAELDSIYGRSTTWSFLKTRTGTGTEGEFDLREARAQSPKVHVYTYMAGLDGALPKNALGSEEQKTKEGDNTAQTAAPAQDPSEGLGQVDYLRRLASQLAREDRRLNADGKAIRAVAVLGSDIYDKLQVLRTLRPQLPDALFLTNNLDARFWHPDEWSETRNMVVAASYPLVPDPKKNEAPPFRDSLQAALYDAARMALRDESARSSWHDPALLFEIGRYGPVRLDDQSSRLPYNSVKAGWCLLCLVGMAWLLWWNSVHLREAPPLPHLAGLAARPAPAPGGDAPQASFWNPLRRPGLMVPAILVFAFVFTSLRYQLHTGPVREPFTLLAGISVWPGDFLRLCVLLLSVHFVYKILHDLKANLHKLEAEFALVHPHDQPLRDDRAGSRWVRFRRNFWPQKEDYTYGGGLVEVRSLWLRYKTWAASHRRLGRSALLLALYLGAVMFLFPTVGELLPNLPVRGTARVLSSLILYASGTATLFVIFLVFDATELNCRSIRALNRARTEWNLAGALERSQAFRFTEYQQALDAEDCADYLDIELIARRSDVVNDLVYYPFILWTMLIIARWELTDDYQWPPVLIFALGANLAWTVYCAVRLPIEANEARRKSLGRLRTKLFARRVEERRAGDGSERKFAAGASVTALEQVITKIETMDRGAFVGVWDQPVLRALLLPSGSAGLWALLQLLPH